MVDEEPKSSRGPLKRSERQMDVERTYTCYKATTRLLHNTSSKSANKSLAKAWHDKAKSTPSFGAATSANRDIPVIKLPLACSITPTLSQLTKVSRRLDMIKTKARLLLEQQQVQIIIIPDRQPRLLILILSIVETLSVTKCEQHTRTNAQIYCTSKLITFLGFVWCPYMVINVSVQYNGGLLPDTILFTLCDYILGNPFNTMESFCPYRQCSHLNILTIVPPRVDVQKF